MPTRPGAVPVAAAAVEAAIELNGVAVDANRAAFAWGRYYVTNPEAVRGMVAAKRTGSQTLVSSVRARAEARTLIERLGLSGVVTNSAERRAADLVDYQSSALATDYVELVARVAEREREVMGSGAADLAAVATYPVQAHGLQGRIRSGPAPPAARDGQGPQSRRQRRHRVPHPAAPPARILRALGMKRKLASGPRRRPVLKLLRATRRLRGTHLDPFGATAVRRLERALIKEYRAIVEDELPDLSPGYYDRAISLARTPDIIRGYEEIHVASVERFRDAVRAIRNPSPV